MENLDQSFSDGRVFCYILHFYLPTLLPRGLVRDATTLTAHLHADTPRPLLLRNNVANLRLFQQRVSELISVLLLTLLVEEVCIVPIYISWCIVGMFICASQLRVDV